LTAIHTKWEARIAQETGIEDPNRVVLLSASAGAVVTLGTYATVVREYLKKSSDWLEDASGELQPDWLVQFARSLDHEASIEAAYRVITWALVAEMAVFFWQPNYEFEMCECAKAFEFTNVHEGEVAALGQALSESASDMEKGTRLHNLSKGTLACAIRAALDANVPTDDPFLNLHFPSWFELFLEGRSVASERLSQLAPDGLPIWRA
jgi:hypothetical protein